MQCILISINFMCFVFYFMLLILSYINTLKKYSESIHLFILHSNQLIFIFNVCLFASDKSLKISCLSLMTKLAIYVTLKNTKLLYLFLNQLIMAKYKALPSSHNDKVGNNLKLYFSTVTDMRNLSLSLVTM